jgi:hypothetical protein
MVDVPDETQGKSIINLSKIVSMISPRSPETCRRPEQMSTATFCAGKGRVAQQSQKTGHISFSGQVLFLAWIENP